MKKIIFTFSLFLILINTFCFVKTNDEKIKTMLVSHDEFENRTHEIPNNERIKPAKSTPDHVFMFSLSV